MGWVLGGEEEWKILYPPHPMALFYTVVMLIVKDRLKTLPMKKGPETGPFTQLSRPLLYLSGRHPSLTMVLVTFESAW